MKLELSEAIVHVLYRITVLWNFVKLRGKHLQQSPIIFSEAEV